MILTRIILRDFMAFEDVDEDLAGVGQLAIVGPNDAGKSALFDALTWCIGGHARGSADQLVREGADVAVVTTVWQRGDVEVVIARSRTRDASSSLLLSVDGADMTRHTIAETQAAIEDLIGTPLSALLASVLMAQRAPGVAAVSLMDLTPGERKAVAFDLFGLNAYDKPYRESLSRIRDADHELAWAIRDQTVATDIVAKEVEVARGLRQRRYELRRLDAAIVAVEAEVEGLARQAEQERAANARRGELGRLVATTTTRRSKALAEMRELAEAIKSLGTPVPEPVRPSPTAVEDAEEAYDAAMHAARHQAEVEAQAKEAGTALRVAERAVATIDVVPCHGVGEFAACRFLVDAVAARKQLPEFVTAAEALRDAVVGFEPVNVVAARAAIARARTAVGFWERWSADQSASLVAIKAKTAQRARLAESVAEWSADLAEWAEEQEALGQASANVALVITETRGRLDEARRQRDLTVERISDAKAEVERIADAKAEVERQKTNVPRIMKKRAILRYLSAAYAPNGVPTLILENGLPLVEARTNDVLSRMPGALAVKLMTQRENKSGGFRETLDVVVMSDGVERAYALFGGGVRFRIDFALRFALGAVLSRGQSFQTLWMDEGWGALDEVGKDALFDALAAVADDFGLIVVVSHVREVTERIGTKLVVTLGPPSTTAMVAA